MGGDLTISGNIYPSTVIAFSAYSSISTVTTGNPLPFNNAKVNLAPPTVRPHTRSPRRWMAFTNSLSMRAGARRTQESSSSLIMLGTALISGETLSQRKVLQSSDS